MNTKWTALPPTGLLCELLHQPAQSEINNPKPKFSWIVNDADHGMHQIACQIMVATSLDKLHRNKADMWDSGLKDPGQFWSQDPKSLHVQYEGKPLKANSSYFWKVRTWNNRNEVSYWSEPQEFRTGPMKKQTETPRQKIIQETESPVKLIWKSSEHLFVDFGKVSFGTLSLTLTVKKSGKIKIHLGEIADTPASINQNPGGSRRYQQLTLSVKKGTHTYQLAIPPDERNTQNKRSNGQAGAILMPKYIGEVFPFRYCEIVGNIGPLQKKDITRLSAYYPFDDQAAYFYSSSPVLNDVWKLCHYSMKATSFLGIYIDGDRERIPYEADAYINQLGHYCCDREYAMARYTHEYLITHPNWPTEWILFSIMLAWADYEYTGDSTSLSKFYTDLQAKALPGLAEKDGLINSTEKRQTKELLESVYINNPLKDIVDWPQDERDNYEMMPVNTVVNAFHVYVLGLLSDIADVLDKETDADIYRKRKNKVTKAMLKYLVDPDTGLFVDGKGSKHSSLHANMFPLAFGIVPEKMIPNIAGFLKKKGMACSVYGAQFLLEALYMAGEDDYALSLMTAPGERGWAHWIYELHSTITLEAWADRFKPNQDWNHAWGAAPANIIPRFLMGMRPLTPGFEKILIQPQPGSLRCAEMTMPTIRGPVTVRFNQGPNKSFYLEIELPANMSGKIVLPLCDKNDPSLTVDGKITNGIIDNNSVSIDNIGSGKHTFSR